MCLDETLNLNRHIKEKSSKAIKGIVIIKKLSKILPQHSLPSQRNRDLGRSLSKFYG